MRLQDSSKVPIGWKEFNQCCLCGWTTCIHERCYCEYTSCSAENDKSFDLIESQTNVDNTSVPVPIPDVVNTCELRAHDVVNTYKCMARDVCAHKNAYERGMCSMTTRFCTTGEAVRHWACDSKFHPNVLPGGKSPVNAAWVNGNLVFIRDVVANTPVVVDVAATVFESDDDLPDLVEEDNQRERSTKVQKICNALEGVASANQVQSCTLLIRVPYREEVIDTTTVYSIPNNLITPTQRVFLREYCTALKNGTFTDEQQTRFEMLMGGNGTNWVQYSQQADEMDAFTDSVVHFPVYVIQY